MIFRILIDLVHVLRSDDYAYYEKQLETWIPASQPGSCAFNEH